MPHLVVGGHIYPTIMTEANVSATVGEMSATVGGMSATVGKLNMF